MKITKRMGRGALDELKTGWTSEDATDGFIEMYGDCMPMTKNQELLALAMIVAISGIKVEQ